MTLYSTSRELQSLLKFSMGKKRHSTKIPSRDKSAASPVVISAADLRKCFDGGEVQRYLKAKRLPTIPIIHFVSFVGGHITIIFGRRYPRCGSAHLRNICNTEFTKELLEPRMVYLFLNITKVTNLMAGDPIFLVTVKSLSGRVLGIIDPELRVQWLEVQG